MTTSTSAPLRIQICGPLAIERDGQRLEAALPGRQGRVLFSFLVVNRHRQVARSELADALWPQAHADTVDARLNPLVSKLRHVLGPASIDARSTVRLQLPHVWIDLEAAREAIHRGESAVARHDWTSAWGPELVALFVAERGFLPGEDAGWVDEVRGELQLLRVRALECYAATSLGIGDTELAAALRAGYELVHLAPLRESGHRALMAALEAQGNLAEALDVYRRLSDELRDQLGVSPSPTTRELYQRLLTET